MARQPRPNRPRQNIGPWLAVAAWLLVIFWLSGSPVGSSDYTGQALAQLVLNLLPPKLVSFLKTNLPPDTFTVTHRLIRKGAHIFVFGVLAVLLFWALSSRQKAPLLSWLITTLFAVADEWQQARLPSRTGSVADVALDSVAALAAIILAILIGGRRQSDPEKGLQRRF